MKIGFLGPRGTFSQQAAEIYTTCEMVEYPSIPELIAAVHNNKVDEAVVPIENSIEGPVNETLDMLAWDVDLKIKKEILVQVVHHLMCKKNNQEIEKILSHPQAIGQCRRFLSQRF